MEIQVYSQRRTYRMGQLRQTPPGTRASEARIVPTAIGILSLVVGLTASLKLQIVGELYVAELLLPIAAIIALASGTREDFHRSPLFRVLVVACLLMVVGYLVSDFHRGTPREDALRGVGRTVLLGTNFVSLIIIGAADRRNIWWFALGFGLGGLIYLRFVANASFTIWKHGYGIDKGYAGYIVPLFAALCYFMPLRVAAFGFVLLAAYSVRYDYRTFTGVCLVIAGALWLRGGRHGQAPRKIKVSTLIGALLAASIVGFGTLGFLAYNESQTSTRRAASDEGRAVGIRFGYYAVMGSPVIGYGSWARSPELNEHYRRAAAETGVLLKEGSVTGAATTHAQLLHAWVEGGILAALFFLILHVEVVRRLPFAILTRPVDPLTPILLYWVAHGLWNFWGAPFAAVLRLDLAAMAVAAVIIASDAARLRRLTSARAPVRREVGRVSNAVSVARRRQET